MRPKKWTVQLTEEEQQTLREMLKKGTHNSRVMNRARILLLAHENRYDREIAEIVGVTPTTVANIRRRYAQRGLEAALYDQPHPRRPPKLDGHQEAYLIAIVQSAPPQGRQRWTLRLLADRLVELGVVDGICPETVRKVLKKNRIKPWVRRQWCIPAIDEEFVARMEDILDLYERPVGPGEVKVCVDERPYQLVADLRPGLPLGAGQPAREDYTYERKGTCNLFVVLAPERGWRDVVLTEQRTKADWGHLLVRLADEVFPEARWIHLVCDNLNTHTLGTLYLVLPPEEARKRAERFCLHPTPKHASWLNMAEIEISALERQCLERRIGDRETLRREVAAWVQVRNEAGVTVHWRFTSRDARQKLARSYPKIKNG